MCEVVIVDIVSLEEKDENEEFEKKWREIMKLFKKNLNSEVCCRA